MEQRILDRIPMPGFPTPEQTLCGLYVLGTLIGMYWEWGSGPLWLRVGTEPLELANACLMAVLPLLLGGWAVFAFGRTGAFAAAGVRGLLLGMALKPAVASGGITLGVLLLFTTLLSGCVMLWFLLRRLRFGRRYAWQDGVLCLGVELAIGLADAIWVAPFLRQALTF